MRITIESADNCEMYTVMYDDWSEEEGYFPSCIVVTPNDLWKALLDMVPYKPDTKRNEKSSVSILSAVKGGDK